MLGFRTMLGRITVLLILAAPGQALESIDHPDPQEFTGLVRTRLAEARERFEAAHEAGELDGAEYGELAMTYDANDQVSAAAQAYRNARELSPRDARWPYFLAQLAYKEGQFGEAERLYRESLELNPDYPPIHIRLAIVLIEQSELEAAREVLEPIVRSHPELAVARAELGRVLLQLGEPQAALEHLETASELQPSATRLNYQIGSALRALGRIEDARERLAQAGDAELAFADPLNEAMRRRSGSSNYWHNLAQRTLATGDTATGMLHLQRAMMADPANVYPHVTLAMTLAETGRSAEALELLRSYQARNPGEPLAAFMVGMLLAGEDRDAEALEQFQAAHDINPDMIEPIILAGNAAMRLERYAEAERWYGRALGLTPNDVSLSLHQAAAQYQAGSCRKAMDTLVLLVPLAPEHPDLLRTYARVAAACPEASAEERENALNASRNLYRLSLDPFTIDTLAVVEAAHGNHQAAEDLLAQAIFQAVRDGADDQVEILRQRLDQARERKLAANPWPPEHPLIHPPRPEAAALGEVQDNDRGE